MVDLSIVVYYLSRIAHDCRNLSQFYALEAEILNLNITPLSQDSVSVTAAEKIQEKICELKFHADRGRIILNNAAAAIDRYTINIQNNYSTLTDYPSISAENYTESIPETIYYTPITNSEIIADGCNSEIVAKVVDHSNPLQFKNIFTILHSSTNNNLIVFVENTYSYLTQILNAELTEFATSFDAFIIWMRKHEEEKQQLMSFIKAHKEAFDNFYSTLPRSLLLTNKRSEYIQAQQAEALGQITYEQVTEIKDEYFDLSQSIRQAFVIYATTNNVTITVTAKASPIIAPESSKSSCTNTSTLYHSTEQSLIEKQASAANVHNNHSAYNHYANTFLNSNTCTIDGNYAYTDTINYCNDQPPEHKLVATYELEAHDYIL